MRTLTVALALLLLIGIATAAVDDSYTVALMHFNNASFTDESGKTVYPGTGVFSSTIYKFGSGSIYNSGAVYGSVYLPDSVDWDFGTDDVTIDVWVNIDSLPVDNNTWTPIYSQSDSYYTYSQLGIVGNSGFKWLAKYGGVDYLFFYGNNTSAISTGTWHHIAAVRDGDTFYLFLDGANIANSQPVSLMGFANSAGQFMVGQSQGEGALSYFPGYMDEFRVSKGIARWTSAFTPPTDEYRQRVWTYTTPGTYYWVCPDYITTISADIGAGGGSGRGTFNYDVYHYSGYGGTSGEHQQYSSISVTPGSTYTIIVGAGGAADPPVTNNADTGNAGGLSSAFGFTKNGGAGALGNRGAGNGGDAIGTGFLTLSRLAQNGTDGTTGYLGGVASTGYSGAGGGAATDTANGAYGGKGADGIVQISQSGWSSGNIPDFSGTPLTGGSGTLVTFTDLSIIGDASDVTYNWSFGDGSYSSTAGNVVHVYSYTGSYTVTLTITSSTDSVSETKEAYINLVVTNQELDLNTEPKAVQFHVQTVWGAPLVGANVSILGISTSTGNWDWLPLLLGIPLDEVALNDTEMYQTTDSLGNAEFLMVPSAKYNVSTTLSGYTFPLFYVVPHDERYTIISNINGSGWFESGNNTLEQVNITVTSDKINNTIGRINVSYNDAGLQTTGGTLYIYTANATRGGADVLVGTMPITSNNFTNSTNVTFTEEFGGQSYTVSAEPIGPGGYAGAVTRTFVVWFKGKTVELAGFDDTILMWFALFVIIFTAMFSGATHAPQVAIIICVESWVFYAMGWFDQLTLSIITPIGGGDAGLIMLLSLATFAAVVWNFREGKRREKGT